MGFFSYFFGNNDNEKNNQDTPIIQTADMRCIWCDNARMNYNTEGIKQIYCTSLGEPIAPPGATKADIEYLCYCSGYRFKPLNGDPNNIGRPSDYIE